MRINFLDHYVVQATQKKKKGFSNKGQTYDLSPYSLLSAIMTSFVQEDI